jgi:hypothetical protein
MIIAVIIFFDTIFIVYDFDIASKKASISAITSSLVLNFFPASILLRSANRKKSLGARSGEYGGWGSNL